MPPKDLTPEEVIALDNHVLNLIGDEWFSAKFELARAAPQLAREVIELKKQVEEAREVAQHLLEYVRSNDVVEQALPDWLYDLEGEEE